MLTGKARNFGLQIFSDPVLIHVKYEPRNKMLPSSLSGAACRRRPDAVETLCSHSLSDHLIRTFSVNKEPDKHFTVCRTEPDVTIEPTPSCQASVPG